LVDLELRNTFGCFKNERSVCSAMEGELWQSPSTTKGDNEKEGELEED
jgi:hypothetical protein